MMKKNLAIWQLVLHNLEQDIPVILLYVLHSEGSSPGRQGFFMAVNKQGVMQGSLGGGIMEHKFVEMAKAKLAAGAADPGVYRQVHDKSSGQQSGMICSGEQTIFLYEVKQSDVNHVSALIQSLELNKNGSLTISPGGLEFSEEVPERNYSFTKMDDDNFVLVERTGYKNIIHIIGGGHCSLAFSKLLRQMDFYIHVYEERPALNTLEQNTYAHEKHIVSSYEKLGEMIPPGVNIYTVIMTFGYRTDDMALRSLMNHRFKYLGLLGSRKKIEKMFHDYRKEGISEDILLRIHAPVGIPIKSQTPEEIAVSIAGEIISVKNQ